MPRSKNPNPRQVTGDEIDGDVGDKGEETNVDSLDDINCKEVSPLSSHEAPFGCEVDEDQNSPTSCAIDDWVSTDKLSPAPEDKPETTSISTLSELDHGANLRYSNELSATSLSQVSLVIRSNEVRKPKTQSSAVLNPRVMTWMRNRFQIGVGGKISASDISNLYKADTQHLENPPPGLQNYQVGQLLRRVFPNITRCKITVGGKRYWVYKHLSLIENPTDDLFEDRVKSKRDYYEDGDSVRLQAIEGLGANESPTSFCEETSIDGEEDVGDETLKLGAMRSDFTEDKDKSNALLLGLLGREPKPHFSSDEVTICQNGGVGMKKKRDSEVIDWLKTSYKYKPGFYVKSMDLLRKYNNGRMEMVKYLSQVGRVMKHVFPGVRHLRKSFKGGKREWVYLNLKPVDVDSDSEEGKSMVMPTMRRSSGWYHTNEAFSTEMQRNSPGWKRERVDISHTPLPAMSTKTVFKHRSDSFHPKSHGIDDKISRAKVTIEDDLPTMVSWTQVDNYAEEDVQDDMDVEDNSCDLGTGFRYDEDPTTRETAGESSQIERHIFAPFTLADNGSLVNEHAANTHLKIRVPNQAQSHSKTGSVLSTDLNSGLRQVAAVNVSLSASHGGAQSGSNACSPALDLSVKSTGADTPRDLNDKIPVTGAFVNTSKSNGIGFSTKPPALLLQSESLATKYSGTLRSHPTIHYRPKQASKGGENFSAVKLEPSVAPNHHNPEMNSTHEDSPISWRSLQAFSAQRYGWMRSPATTSLFAKSDGDTKIRKNPRYVEWFLIPRAALVNNQRALKEIRIYDDWTVEIHALGRRVYPNDLGGITDLDKTPASLNKVFRVLAEAKLCTGFPAPSINDLYIHGILVSRREVWSSRDGGNEEARQRAVNCQVMYLGPNACCAKCMRIMRLYQQQKKSVAGKRANPDSPTTIEKRVKCEKI